MKNRIKYAALNLSIPTMLVMWLMSAGAFAEGQISRLVPAVTCLVLTLLIRRAWNKVQQMDRLFAQEKQARQIARRARAMAVQGHTDGDHLRVA